MRVKQCRGLLEECTEFTTHISQLCENCLRELSAKEWKAFIASQGKRVRNGQEK